MFDQPDIDPREFGPQHSMCRECLECTCDDCDGHSVACSHHPEFFNAPVREIEPEEVEP